MANGLESSLPHKYLKINRLISLLNLCVCLLAISCQEENRTQIPTNIIAPDKMEAILSEIHQLESNLLQTGIRQDSTVPVFEFYQKQIYAKYQVDTGSVNRSVRFYTQHVELLDSIYTKMEIKESQAEKK